jgi:hypothetical protein
MKDDVRPAHGRSAGRIPGEGQILVVDTVPVTWSDKLGGFYGLSGARRIEDRHRPGEVRNDVRFDVADCHYSPFAGITATDFAPEAFPSLPR